jgi:hypothetical protein
MYTNLVRFFSSLLLILFFALWLPATAVAIPVTNMSIAYPWRNPTLWTAPSWYKVPKIQILADIVECPEEQPEPPAITDGDCERYRALFEQYDWPVDVALFICKNESRGRINAIGDGDTAYVSCGLMQIRELSGRPSCEEMKDPAKNIAYAYYLWKNEGWGPWRWYVNLYIVRPS